MDKIVAIKASINLGLNEELKLAFPDIVPVTRPLVENTEIPHPEWMTGFITGEGCFFIKLGKNSKFNVGHQVQLEFVVGQHVRDKQLINKFVTWFGCGKIDQNPTLTLVTYQVYKFSDIISKIIPYFKKYSLVGDKIKDFNYFCKVAEIMDKKGHLNPEGLEQISQIKAGMNRKRILD